LAQQERRRIILSQLKNENHNEDHHWVGKEPDPKNAFGFIYKITNRTNGRMYLGKKQYYFTRLVQSKSGKKRIRIIKPSSWEYYTGSSKELNKDIEKTGKYNFEFEILYNCYSKSMLHWMEIKTQVFSDVLLQRLDGSDIPLYYNRQIAGIKFIPKGECK